jgi:hypothetical protein
MPNAQKKPPNGAPGSASLKNICAGTLEINGEHSIGY